MLEFKVHDGEREVVLQFEHSLLSLSKWESKHLKPFMSNAMKKPSEMIEYFEDMIVTPDVDRNLVYALDPEQLDALATYINASKTASSVPKDQKPQFSQETITSELIYYWMTAMKINWEAQTWHLSRLMILIEITNYKMQPEKKRSVREVYADWREANERQKKMFNTSG